MIQSTETARVTIRQTETPSRSKMAGPCWVRIGTDHQTATYATDTERTVEAPKGSTIVVVGKAILRRATRNSLDRTEVRLVVTGDPADTVTVAVVPGYVEATLTGVVQS